METRLKLSESCIGNTNGQGEKNHFSKLKEFQVRIIKRLLKHKTLSHKEISRFFDIKKSCVTKISTGRTWKHITQERIV